MSVNKKYIVITGGIASGKSKVSSYVSEKGYLLVDADAIAREVVLPGSIGFRKLVEHFGDEIIQGKALDRKKLGEIIFSNEDARSRLNDILHPLIFERMGERGRSHGDKIIFYDIPLYFEVEGEILKSGMNFDEVWIVTVGKETQIARLMERDNISRNYAIQKISSQMPLPLKERRGDVVIHNDGTIEELYEQVDRELKRLESSL